VERNIAGEKKNQKLAALTLYKEVYAWGTKNSENNFGKMGIKIIHNDREKRFSINGFYLLYDDYLF